VLQAISNVWFIVTLLIALVDVLPFAAMLSLDRNEYFSDQFSASSSA
jgi:hypothetical protein